MAAVASQENPETTRDDLSIEKGDESKEDGRKKDIFAKKKKKTKKASKVADVNPDEMAEEKVKKEKTMDEIDEEAGAELGIQMAMPTRTDMWGYSASMKLWRVKKTLFPIVKAYRNRYNAYKLASGASPRQKTLKTKKKYVVSSFSSIFADGSWINFVGTLYSEK